MIGLKRKIQTIIDKNSIRKKIEEKLNSSDPTNLWVEPKFIKVTGSDINLGKFNQVFGQADRHTQLTTYQDSHFQGKISIKDYVLISPGVRIESAEQIEIGSNSMIASNVYITDCDWHDLYNRCFSIGTPKSVIIEDNVWIGYGAIILKGSRIGKNSVVGAGSVVSGEVPPNVVVAGNPAKIIKNLDRSKPLKQREDLYRFNLQMMENEKVVSSSEGVLQKFSKLLLNG